MAAALGGAQLFTLGSPKLRDSTKNKNPLFSWFFQNLWENMVQKGR